MADEMNGHALELPIHNTNPNKTCNFQNDGTLVCDSENWCTYSTWFVLSSGVFYVFDQTLAEQLCCDKSL